LDGRWNAVVRSGGSSTDSVIYSQVAQLKNSAELDFSTVHRKSDHTQAVTSFRTKTTVATTQAITR
jgi:hypothetical protein